MSYLLKNTLMIISICWWLQACGTHERWQTSKTHSYKTDENQTQESFAIQKTTMGKNFEYHEKEIIIYYANETQKTSKTIKNHENLMSTIKETKIESLQDFWSHLKDDPQEFNHALQQDIHLKEKKWNGQLTQLPIPVIVITNQMANQGYFLEIHNNVIKKHSISFDQKGDQPLSQKNLLLKVLTLATKLYAPDRYGYNLHINSHGDGEKILRPLLNFDSSKISSDKFKQLYQKALSKSKTTQQNPKGSDVGKGSDARKGVKQLLKVIENELPTTYEGVSKNELLSALSTLGENNAMKFHSIILDSCFSSVSDTKIPNKNIAAIYSFKGSASYTSVDYSKNFRKKLAQSNFQLAIDKLLKISQ